MIQVGKFNTLTINRKVDFGFYLDDGKEGILLPKRFAPNNAAIGDEVVVFIYHDSDNRLIATTQQPKGVVDDIVLLKCVSTTSAGAFLDWGLMKDLFVAKSQQKIGMRKDGWYLVKIYIDTQTGRIAATEKIDRYLNNEHLTVKEMDEVNITIYRQTDIGYSCIINNIHLGLIHNNQVFQNLEIGNNLKGFVKTIREDNKIDIVLGKAGYKKIEDKGQKIIRLLKENNGYLPYHDKSAPEDVYHFFGMSKKTFKMTTGSLYKQHKINFTKTGIMLVEE
ncbi:MAG: RNA-binding protein [Chitinophagaceae bacterium]|nr:RNA-binding protein [Chitinophagaceae bacterium]MCW5904864.1 RNA-binding protein [Chitinophagaceae bacterium]